MKSGLRERIIASVVVLIIAALVFWWLSGYKSYETTYVFNGQPANTVGKVVQCHDNPYGVAWRVGHLPELLIEGGCR